MNSTKKKMPPPPAAKNQRSILNYFKPKGSAEGVAAASKRPLETSVVQNEKKTKLITIVDIDIDEPGNALLCVAASSATKDITPCSLEGDGLEIMEATTTSYFHSNSSNDCSNLSTSGHGFPSANSTADAPAIVDEDTEFYTVEEIKEYDFVEMNDFLECTMSSSDDSRSSQKSDRSLKWAYQDELDYKDNDYKLRNFRHMIDFVLKDDHNSHLFNDEDWSIIEKFTSLSCKSTFFRSVLLYLRPSL